MTELCESVEVHRPISEVFDYVADFTTTVEWDTTAIEALKTSPGPLGVGTIFDVTCTLPVGSVCIVYTVEEYCPNERIVLGGTCRFFDIRDTITFTDLGDDLTRINYQAVFDFPPFLARLAERYPSGLQKMGRDSVDGLGRALESREGGVPVRPTIERADRLVLPGVALFTRMGYRLARKHFQPMSRSVKGQHMLVTGASTGLGYASAVELARRGAALTLVFRDEGKAKTVVEELRAETGNDDIRYRLADLQLMRDVDALVADVLQQGRPIDVLVNNAGALFNERFETDESHEASLALLLASPYRLTLGLKPLLGAGSRVINVVSGGMYTQRLDVASLTNPQDDYDGPTAYAREKRALMVLTEEWAQTWADEGIIVNAMHPGWADTPGVQSALPGFRKLTHRVLRSPEEGADTIVWLAVAEEAGEASGKLFLDRQARATHLLEKTREKPVERERLMDYLSREFAPSLKPD